MPKNDIFSLRAEDEESLIESIIKKEFPNSSKKDKLRIKVGLWHFPHMSKKIYALLHGYYGRGVRMKEICDNYYITYCTLHYRYHKVESYLNRIKNLEFQRFNFKKL